MLCCSLWLASVQVSDTVHDTKEAAADQTRGVFRGAKGAAHRVGRALHIVADSSEGECMGCIGNLSFCRSFLALWLALCLLNDEMPYWTLVPCDHQPSCHGNRTQVTMNVPCWPAEKAKKAAEKSERALLGKESSSAQSKRK